MVSVNDMRASVFVYDYIIHNTPGRDDETLMALLPLHHKKAVDVQRVHLDLSPQSRLAPKRRIHKIMKHHDKRLRTNIDSL